MNTVFNEVIVNDYILYGDLISQQYVNAELNNRVQLQAYIAMNMKRLQKMLLFHDHIVQSVNEKNRPIKTRPLETPLNEVG